MSTCPKSIHIFRKLSIKYDLPFPRIFTFSTIREIDTKNIEHTHIRFQNHLDMCYSTFICCRITRETIEKSDGRLLIDSIMDPYSCPSISCFFCRIVVGSIIWWREKIWRELIWSGLDLLHEENIWIVFLDQILDFSFFFCSSDTVYIPGDDFHNYSTVTDFARLRGLSISRPRKFAT